MRAEQHLDGSSLGKGREALDVIVLKGFRTRVYQKTPPVFRRLASAATSEVLSGLALVSWQVLFRVNCQCRAYWAACAWVRGGAVRAAGFSHAVHYGPKSPLWALAVVLPFDATSQAHEPAGRPGWALLLSGHVGSLWLSSH